ncbi:MAG: hypothetical protein ACRCWP_00780 [Shewanella sp.]
MFTLTIKKSLQMSVLLGALGASVAVHAEAAPITDVIVEVEQTLTTLTQEILVNAKQELVLSLQTQLAESIYDFNRQLSLSAENKIESANVGEYSVK